ncbi:hypothetical protein WDU94_000390 [Cyamophila willieti]
MLNDHLNIHKKTHDLRKPHQCSLCNRGYNTVAALTSHLQKHSKTHAATDPGSPPPGAAQFKCLDCETKFGTPEELQNHMKDEHNVQPASSEPHTTPSPSLLSPLSRSISKLHASAASAYQSSPSPLSFPLQFPLASSPSRYSSSPTSMARYMCNYCPTGSEGFSSLESLHVHIQSVHGSLLNNQDLIRELSHRLSHSLSSPLSLSPSLSLSPFPSSNSPSIPCLFCTLRFSSTDALRMHISSAHARTDLSAIYRFSPPAADLQTKPTDLTVNKKHKLKTTNNNNNNNNNNSSNINNNNNNNSLTNNNSFDSKKIKLNGISNNNVDELSPVIKHYENAHKLHICSQCDASFPDLASFSQHQKSHLENDLQARLKNNNNLTSVLDNNSSHTDSKPRPPPQPNLIELQCKHCSSVFGNLAELSEHFVSHCLTMVKLFSCPACQSSFGSSEELTKHLGEAHVAKLYKCSLCSETYESKLLIQLHLTQAHHKELKLYRCTKCPLPSPSKSNGAVFPLGASFPSHAEFTAHVRSAHPLQPSDICTRIVPQLSSTTTESPSQGHHTLSSKPPSLSPSTLKSLHISSPNQNQALLSTNQNALFCDLCERKDFLSEPELAAHRKLHVSLSCAYCAENFKSRSDLESHMRTHSVGAGPSVVATAGSGGAGGKHKCNICDEIFTTASGLAEHKLTHCKVIYGTTCTKCKGSVTTETAFLQHLQQHSTTSSNTSNSSSSGNILLPTSCIICCQTLNTELETKLHSNFHLKANANLSANLSQTANSIPANLTPNTLSSVASSLQNIQHSVATSLQSIQHSVATSMAASIQNSVVNSLQTSMASFVSPSSTGGGVKSTGEKDDQQQLRKMIEYAHAQAEKHQKNGGGKSAGLNQFSCAQCSVSFDSHEALQNHIVSQRCQRSSNAHTAHECRLCCQIYPDAVSLQAHLIEHTFEGLSSYTCFVCLTQFTGVSGLQSHIRTHHPGPASRSYECNHCPDVRFFFKAELENHTLIVHGTGESSRNRSSSDPATDYEKMSNYFQYQKSLQQYQQQQHQLQYKHQQQQQQQHRSDENNGQRARNGRSELSSLRENHRELLAKRRKYSAELSKARDEIERRDENLKKENQKYEDNISEDNNRDRRVGNENEQIANYARNSEKDSREYERINHCDDTDESFVHNNQTDDRTDDNCRKQPKQNEQDNQQDNDVDMCEQTNEREDLKSENEYTHIEKKERLGIVSRLDENQDVDMNGKEEERDEEMIGKLGKIKRESMNDDSKEDKCDNKEDERRIDLERHLKGVKVEIKKEVLAEDEDIDVGNVASWEPPLTFRLISDLRTTIILDVDNLGTTIILDVDNLGTTIILDVDHLGTTIILDVDHLGTTIILDVDHLGTTIILDVDHLGTTIILDVDHLGTTIILDVDHLGTTIILDVDHLGTTIILDVDHLG